MAVAVYKRILDLFEAEGVKTLFGIPDPNFVHMFLEAESRGWTVVSPPSRRERRVHGRSRLADDGQAGLVHRHAGSPGVANIAGAMMCAKVGTRPSSYSSGGQRARITERRVRRGRNPVRSARKNFSRRR